MLNMESFLSMLESKVEKDGHNYVTLLNNYKENFVELHLLVDKNKKLNDILSTVDIKLSDILYKIEYTNRSFFKEGEYEKYIKILKDIIQVIEED